MAEPRSGETVTIAIGGTVLGHQQDATITETNEEKDLSSKESRFGKYGYGRYGSTVDFSALFVESDTAYTALKDASRSGNRVDLAQFRDGVSYETASGVITNLSHSFPDQAPATISATVRVDGEWS